MDTVDNVEKGDKMQDFRKKSQSMKTSLSAIRKKIRQKNRALYGPKPRAPRKKKGVVNGVDNGNTQEQTNSTQSVVQGIS